MNPLDQKVKALVIKQNESIKNGFKNAREIAKEFDDLVEYMVVNNLQVSNKEEEGFDFFTCECNHEHFLMYSAYHRGGSY